MNHNYCIYKHTNKTNGKVYIGMTNNYHRRWRNNGIEYQPKDGRQSRFWGAIQKYGWNGFTHEILKDGLSQREAEQQEIETIALYDSTNRNKGYNISKGGNGGKIYAVHPRGMLGKHQSEYEIETHKKMLSDPKQNPMTNGSVVWGVTQPHPRGMLGKHQSQKHQLAMSKYRGKNAFNHRSFTIFKPDGSTLHFDSTKEFIDKYKIWQVYKMLRLNKPYALPQQNMPNKAKYAQFDGCLFKYDDQI